MLVIKKSLPSQKEGQASNVTEKTTNKKGETKEQKESASNQSPSTSSADTECASLYHNPANGERSFIMLKPDAVHRGLIGQIVARFEKKGFKLLAMKFMQANQDLLKRHYADLSKKGFFSELIR